MNASPRLPASRPRVTVAIIGGGFSGAAVAFHLAGNPDLADDAITVFEPRAEIGRGLAYDTEDRAHRINVPAGRMSPLSGRPDDFLDWIATNDAMYDDPEAVRPDGLVFPRRFVFCAYVHDNLKPFLRDGRVKHLRSRVTSVEKRGDGWNPQG